MTNEGKKARPAASVREVAADVLYHVLEEGAYSHIELMNAFRREGMKEKKERAFVTRVCMGTLERLYAVDAVIDAFSKTKTEKLKPYIRTILRMSIYQLRYLDQTPTALVCNEAVRLTKKRGLAGLSGFVNGVLRSAAREPEKPDFTKLTGKKALSVQYSIPEWLLAQWLARFGEEKTGKILEGFYREKQVCVRRNRSRIEEAELVERLGKAGIEAKPGAYVKDALRLEQVSVIEEIPEWKEGYFQIQDESSMLVGLAAGYKKGDLVMDICAAPGGKSLHAADILASLGGGQVIARDISDYKCSLIEENRKRAGFSNLKIEVWDATKIDESKQGSIDVLLCDLPCSGLGIIGRKPEIKYRISREDLEGLAKLQREILTVAKEYVKPGGTLIYSTCTINPKENEENVSWLLEQGFETEDLRPYLPESLHQDTMDSGYIQLLPGVHESDGFFVARLRKKEGSQQWKRIE
ncbi:MAG: 16S rRNA (cytosine(967)-C(5))-methyltransferase RsmB [Lachnospiraceae bacterium]|nr:16S rRNA (cytosine(967)-C(5))-methyltransferase RsmB [Lachnospiraceae bacterium]